MIMKAKLLNTDRLILKPLSLEHLSHEYVDWLNDPEVNKFLSTGGNYTLEMLKEFLTDVEKKDIYFWGIHLKENHQHIGNIKIDPINPKTGVAEYGIMMGCKAEWGKGYAKEATQRVLAYCFSELKLRKITLGVVFDNTAALYLYRSIGFEIEGVFKKHGFYIGKYCDVVRMAIFNPEIVSIDQ